MTESAASNGPGTPSALTGRSRTGRSSSVPGAPDTVPLTFQRRDGRMTKPTPVRDSPEPSTIGVACATSSLAGKNCVVYATSRPSGPIAGAMRLRGLHDDR